MSSLPKKITIEVKTPRNLGNSNLIEIKSGIEEKLIEYPSVRTPTNVANISRQATFCKAFHGESLKSGLITPRKEQDFSPPNNKKAVFLKKSTSHKRLLSPGPPQKKVTNKVQIPEINFTQKIAKNAIKKQTKLAGLDPRTNKNTQSNTKANLILIKQPTGGRNVRKNIRATFERIPAPLGLPDDSNYNNIVSFIDDLKDSMDLSGNTRIINNLGNSPKNQQFAHNYLKSFSQKLLYPVEEKDNEGLYANEFQEKVKANCELKNKHIIVMRNKLENVISVKETQDNIKNNESIHTSASPEIPDEKNNKKSMPSSNINTSGIKKEFHIQKGEQINLFPNLRLGEIKLQFSMGCILFFDGIPIEY